MKIHWMSNWKLRGHILTGLVGEKEITALLAEEYTMSGFSTYRAVIWEDDKEKIMTFFIIFLNDQIVRIFGVKNLDPLNLSYQCKHGNLLHFYDTDLEDFCVDIKEGKVVPGVCL